MQRILGVLVASVAPASGAGAEPLVEPVQIDYRAPEGCPSAAWFEAQVLARTPRVRRGRADERARSFAVALERCDRWRGRLVERGLDGRDTDREVEGEDCGEVASALALVLALTVDPNALTERTIAPSLDPRPPQAAAPSPPASPPHPTPPPRPALSSRVPRPAAPVRVSTGVSASVATGISPEQMFGGIVYAEVGRSGATLSPSVRLSVERSLGGRIDLGAGAADFARTMGALMVYPWHFVLDRLAVAPYAVLEVGALHADGSGVAAPARPTRPWVGLGLGAGMCWTLYGPLVVDLGAGAVVPFLRDGFYFEPNRDRIVSRAEVLGFRGTAGLGVRIP